MIHPKEYTIDSLPVLEVQWWTVGHSTFWYYRHLFFLYNHRSSCLALPYNLPLTTLVVPVYHLNRPGSGCSNIPHCVRPRARWKNTICVFALPCQYSNFEMSSLDDSDATKSLRNLSASSNPPSSVSRVSSSEFVSWVSCLQQCHNRHLWPGWVPPSLLSCHWSKAPPPSHRPPQETLACRSNAGEVHASAGPSFPQASVLISTNPEKDHMLSGSTGADTNVEPASGTSLRVVQYRHCDRQVFLLFVQWTSHLWHHYHH